MDNFFWISVAVTGVVVTIVSPVVYLFKLRKMWAMIWSVTVCLLVKWGLPIVLANILLGGIGDRPIFPVYYPWEYPLFSILCFPTTIGEYWNWVSGYSNAFPFVITRLTISFCLMNLMEAALLLIIKPFGFHQLSYGDCIKITSMANVISYGIVVLVFTLVILAN